MAHLNVKHLFPSPHSLSPSLLYFSLWQLSLCHIPYITLSLLLSPALEHQFYESKLLSLLFGAITPPSMSGAGREVA